MLAILMVSMMNKEFDKAVCYNEHNDVAIVFIVRIVMMMMM